MESTYYGGSYNYFPCMSHLLFAHNGAVSAPPKFVARNTFALGLMPLMAFNDF